MKSTQAVCKVMMILIVALALTFVACLLIMEATSMARQYFGIPASPAVDLTPRNEREMLLQKLEEINSGRHVSRTDLEKRALQLAGAEMSKKEAELARQHAQWTEAKYEKLLKDQQRVLQLAPSVARPSHCTEFADDPSMHNICMRLR